jgi:hypothetical protein
LLSKIKIAKQHGAVTGYFIGEGRDNGLEQALVAGTMVLQDRTKEGLLKNNVKIIESGRKKMKTPCCP